jgi:hypothetical protein
MWQYLAIMVAVILSAGYLFVFARKVYRGQVDHCNSCGSGSETAPKIKVTPLVGVGIETEKTEA